MTSLQSALLEYLCRKPRTIDQLFRRYNRAHPLRRVSRAQIERAVDALEDAYLIEELGESELAAYHGSGEEFRGVVTDFSGYYLAGDPHGVEVAEAQRAERRRFYLPLAVSWLLTLISIAISVLALVQSSS